MSVVDFTAFEGSKENIQPLKQGRNPLALKKQFENVDKKPTGAVEDKLAKEREAKEAAIHNYEGDDPLIPWLNYITWTQQNYSSGGLKSYLVQLLEKCTKQFQNDERYRNNLKYLQVWIIYADTHKDAEEVFDFLQHNNIGQQCALFWEAWALVLEEKKKFAQADAVLEKGIAMGAQPISRLKNTHRRLQLRAVKRVQKQMAAQADPFNVASAQQTETVPKPRQVLGRISTKRRSLKSQIPRQNLLQSSRTSASSQSNSTQFQVFCDDDSASVANERPASSNTGSTTSSVVWNDFGTQQEKSKENSGVVSTWNSGPLPSQAKKKKKNRVS